MDVRATRGHDGVAGDRWPISPHEDVKRRARREVVAPNGPATIQPHYLGTGNRRNVLGDPIPGDEELSLRGEITAEDVTTVIGVLPYDEVARDRGSYLTAAVGADWELRLRGEVVAVNVEVVPVIVTPDISPRAVSLVLPDDPTA